MQSSYYAKSLVNLTLSNYADDLGCNTDKADLVAVLKLRYFVNNFNLKRASSRWG